MPPDWQRMKTDRVLENSNSKSPWALPAVIAVLLLSALVVQLWIHITRTSVTIDEPAHILAGYRHLQCGDYGINPEHPPLLKMIAAAPLMFMELVQPPWDCGSKLTTKFDSFTYGNSFLVENGVDRIVVATRTGPAIVTVILAIVVFFAALDILGRWAAVVALGIVAFEPSIIGHGSIVTTDVAITTTTLLTVWLVYRFAVNRSWINLVLSGLGIGLMLASKHSAVILLAILAGVLIADAIIFRKNDDGGALSSVSRRVAAFAAMFMIGWSILWCVYGLRYYAVPAATSESASIQDYVRENGRPEVVNSMPARATYLVASSHTFPESYVLGMADVIAWGARNTWLFGTNYPTGQWFYFPIAFVVKSSLALLLLTPLGLLLPLIDPEKRRASLFLLLPALAFFAIAMTSSFTTGVRHILPVYALFIVASAGGIVSLANRHRALVFVFAAVLVYSAVATVRAAPNYLAFSNDIWGGVDRTHEVFRDSNADTGQSVKQVTEYIQREGIQECWIATFSHPDLIEAIQPCRPMPSNLRILISRRVLEPVPQVIEGTVFVSVNELPPRNANDYVPITQGEPLGMIGGNVLVYRGRFEVPIASAVSHAQRSSAFLRLGQTEEAVDEGRRSVELAPEDPRTHLALGMALLRAKMPADGRSELERALSLAAADPVFRNLEARARQELSKLK